ncbi:MAG: hypothetical protein QGH33_00640, partial [Pirellulaceae bacterium]|nr:hypothetical protein [Pirellulaceae bacterium]
MASIVGATQARRAAIPAACEPSCCGRIIHIMALRYHAAAIQTAFDPPAHRDEIAARVDRMCEMAEQTITGYEPFCDVRLIVFPEFAHAVPIHDTVAKLREELAVELPNEH